MRRLLVVSYYFPPSGGAGVQRVLKWVKYLRDFGVEPVVLAVEAGAYPKTDPTLAQDVPKGVAVHRTRSLDPFGAYARLTGRTRQQAVAETSGHVGADASGAERFAQWVRANVFVPDARVGWVPFAVQRGLRLLRREPFDAVLTSGPPHSVHLTGWALHARTGIPWVADFRDPWTDINYYDELPRTAAAHAADRWLERGVLERATRVVTVSPGWRGLLLSKVDRAPGDFAVIHNGYDVEDFGPGQEPPEDRFTLVYVGSLYGSRNPDVLWRSLAALRARGEIPHLRLRLVGRIGADVLTALEGYGLDAITEHVPYVPHDEAVREMQRATLLFLTIESYRQERGNLTGKIYEYLAAGRPVLALGPVAGDAADLLENTGAGQMLDRADAGGVAEYLQVSYAAWECGEMQQGASSEAAAPYSRRVQAGKLAALIETLRSEGRDG
jgi:glycosyltransferase involved in cell wall biosynthesis